MKPAKSNDLTTNYNPFLDSANEFDTTNRLAPANAPPNAAPTLKNKPHCQPYGISSINKSNPAVKQLSTITFKIMPPALKAMHHFFCDQLGVAEK